MARGGRTLGRLALIAALVSLAAEARAQPWPRIELPDCESEAIDLARVRAAISLELDRDAAMEEVSLIVADDICEAEAREVRFTLRDARGLRADGVVVLSGADRAARERALALAIAERTRLFVLRRDRERVIAAPAPSSEQIRTRPSMPRATPHEERRDPFLLLGIDAGARAMPLGASWIAGGRIGLRAVVFAPLVLGVELGVDGTRGEVDEGTIDAFLFGASAIAGVALWPAPEWSFEIDARFTLAAVHAIGRRREGTEAMSTTQPWSSLELLASLWFWIDPRIAIGGGLAIGAVLYGFTIEEHSGVPVDLTGLVCGADLGLRVAP